MKVKHTRNGPNASNNVTNSKGYTILARVNHTRNGLNPTNDVKNSKGYKILVRVKYTRIWCKLYKRPQKHKTLSFNKTMSKTQNVLLVAKTVSKTQKASHCETVKNPLGDALQRNGVENPKGLSLRNGQKPVRGCTFIWGKNG